MNTIMKALEVEICEYVRPMIAGDEEFHTRYHSNGSLIVEFSVVWIGFILRLIIWVDGYGIHILKVKNIDSNEIIYSAELANPQTIDNLLKLIIGEWDRYLGREATIVHI